MENAQILTELYEVIKQNTPDQYARIIRERASYSFCTICRKFVRT